MYDARRNPMKASSFSMQISPRKLTSNSVYTDENCQVKSGKRYTIKLHSSDFAVSPVCFFFTRVTYRSENIF